MCFFFKQKAAYEMRISDRSSDVCSSDLSVSARLRAAGQPVDDGLAQGGVEMIERGGDLRVAGGFGGHLQQQRRTHAAALTGTGVAVVARHFRGQVDLAIEPDVLAQQLQLALDDGQDEDRKSTRLNS